MSNVINVHDLNPYEKRYVVFIDILGFTRYVERSVTDSKLYGKIQDSITMFDKIKQAYQEQSKKNNDDVRISTFSDSLVISFPESAHPKNIIISLNWIHNLFSQTMDFLLRGGLTYGLIFHSDNRVFGPAFIRAYELESDIAKNPRIIIDTNITRSEINNKTTLGTLLEAMDVCKKDDDEEFSYCNFIQGIHPQDLEHMINSKHEQFVKIKNDLDLESEIGKNIVSKWSWFIDKLNDGRTSMIEEI